MYLDLHLMRILSWACSDLGLDQLDRFRPFGCAKCSTIISLISGLYADYQRDHLDRTCQLLPTVVVHVVVYTRRCHRSELVTNLRC